MWGVSICVNVCGCVKCVCECVGQGIFVSVWVCVNVGGVWVSVHVCKCVSVCVNVCRCVSVSGWVGGWV